MHVADSPDARTAAAIVQAQFPELAPASAEYLGEGCDSTAFVVNGRWVFRFPRRADVEQQIQLEWDVLRMLADSPLPVPNFQFNGQPSRLFPRRFVGYPMLPGTPAIHIDPATIPASAGTTLGGFMSWLHDRRLDPARRLGLPESASGAVIAETGAEAVDDLERARAAGERWPIGAWQDLVRDLPAAGDRVALIHADLAAEHLLFDQPRGALTGVIDWSDVAIGDPALDLASAWHWGDERLLEAVLAAYTGLPDQGLERRALFLAACRGAGDIAFGLDTGRSEYVTAGVRALRFCASRI